MDPITAGFNTLTALATFATELIKTPEGQKQVAFITEIMTTVHHFLHRHDSEVPKP
jgi:hypothetical protein